MPTIDERVRAVNPVNPDDTFYDNQIERFLSQIIRAFSGFRVKDGVSRNKGTTVHEQKVPVIFGSPSRVVAALISNDKEFRNVRVPMMAVGLSGIEPDDESRLNPYHETEIGVKRYNNDMLQNVNIRRISGVPLRMNVDLNIYASSVSQLMEIFERIVLTFYPELTIQKSTNALDPDYLTSIKLEGISNEISRPLGQNHRTVEMTLQFSAPIRLSYPLKESDPLESVRLRVFNAENGKTELAADETFVNVDITDVPDAPS